MLPNLCGRTPMGPRTYNERGKGQGMSRWWCWYEWSYGNPSISITHHIMGPTMCLLRKRLSMSRHKEHFGHLCPCTFDSTYSMLWGMLCGRYMFEWCIGMVGFMGKSWLRKDVCEDGWGLDDVLNMSWSFLRVQQCKTIGRANLSVRMRKIDLSLPLFTSILQILIFFLMTFFVVCNGSMHENVSSKSIQWVEMHVELEVPIIKSHTLMCMLASVCWCDFKTSSWDQVNIFPTINFETSRRMMAYISLHLLVGKHCSWATNYVIDDLSLMPLTIKKYENMNLTKASKEKPYLICIIYGLFKSLDP